MIPLEEIFELLSDVRGRYVLYELRETQHVDLDELSARVAARENDVTVDFVSADKVEQVKISLHHHVLPKLQEAHLLEYDARQRDIRATSAFPLVEKYLDIASQDEEE